MPEAFSNWDATNIQYAAERRREAARQELHEAVEGLEKLGPLSDPVLNLQAFKALLVLTEKA